MITSATTSFIAYDSNEYEYKFKVSADFLVDNDENEISLLNDNIFIHSVVLQNKDEEYKELSENELYNLALSYVLTEDLDWTLV